VTLGYNRRLRGSGRTLEVAISQSHHSAPDKTADPACAKCRAPMGLESIEEKYPGYYRRAFECPSCGATMTQWADSF